MTTTIPRLLILSSLVCGLVSCSDNGFKGSANATNAPKAADAEGPGISVTEKPDPGEVNGGSPTVEPPSSADKAAIKGCMAAWGESAPKFPLDNVRKILSQISVGSSGQSLQDNQKTELPALTIVYSSINVDSNLEWNLLNPNGWYCIVSAINVDTKLVINIDKSSHIASSQGSINVDPKTNGSVAASEINVDSDITVNRK